MQTEPIRAQDARSHLGDLLNQVYYQNKQFQINRKDKPMAWLVGQNFMEMAGQAIDYIIEHKPALADTMAIMLDDEMRSVIDNNKKEMASEERLPLASILEE